VDASARKGTFPYRTSKQHCLDPASNRLDWTRKTKHYPIRKETLKKNSKKRIHLERRPTTGEGIFEEKRVGEVAVTESRTEEEKRQNGKKQHEEEAIERTGLGEATLRSPIGK